MEKRNEKDFIAILRAHGLQVTSQRLAIYQTLYHTLEHPGAEEIYQRVRKRFPALSLGTVYKTLERFHDVGLIQKVSPMTEVSRYDANIFPHHHLVCIKCHAIQDIADSLLEQKIDLLETNGFHVLCHQVLFQGYCPECHQKERVST